MNTQHTNTFAHAHAHQQHRIIWRCMCYVINAMLILRKYIYTLITDVQLLFCMYCVQISINIHFVIILFKRKKREYKLVKTRYKTKNWNICFRIHHKISRSSTEYAQMLLFTHSRNKFRFRFCYIIAWLCYCCCCGKKRSFVCIFVIQLFLCAFFFL